MELPDEAIQYNYQALLAPPAEEWTAGAELRAKNFLTPSRFKELHQRLMQVRGQIAADRELRNPPPEMLPLEPGFINLPQELLDGYRRKQDASDLGKVIVLANHLREESDRVVFLGAGGSYLGGKALFSALRSSFHNELPPETRLGVPRIYFDGHTADNDALQELLDLLQITCVDPERREERWSVVCVSKSGLTIEPAVALRVFRREANEYYGLRSPWLTSLFAAVTGPSTRTRELFKSLNVGDASILTVPENVGGRFSVLSPAGLLSAAVAGLDVRAILIGAAAMTKRFLEEPVERNPVLQFAGLNHLLHTELDKPLRVMSVWSRKLEAVGHWYEHLVSESLGKQGRGPTPLTQLQPRDLHARGQQMQEGPRDRVVNNLSVKSPAGVPIMIGMADHNEDELNQYNRRSMTDLLNSSHKAVNAAHYETGRPTADIVLPALTEHTMGQLLQMLMLATVVEGRLMGVNPYSQPGADAMRSRVASMLLRAPETVPSSPGSQMRPGFEGRV